jgi:hypothetical protein
VNLEADQWAHGKFWILNEEGEPEAASLLEWAAWMERDRERIVLQTAVGARQRVSTVFLGLDYRFFENGPPLLWETMVFGGPFDDYQARATSKLEALRNHGIALRLVEAFRAAPRVTKKALRKYGAYARLEPGERWRVHRVLARVGAPR